MITTKLSNEKLKEYRKLYIECRNSLKPNRKSGQEVDRYFVDTYNATRVENPIFKKVVEYNILTNDFKLKKLSRDARPSVNVYLVDDALVGIDVVSGEFHVECSDIDRMSEIYDNLFAFRGLDKDDLKNFVLVGEYIKCTQKRG